MVDRSLDINQWQFFANQARDLPQQSNSYDCGVFVSLYARCLVVNDAMLCQPSIQHFRKHMIAELHKKTLLTISPIISVGDYYAVDYVSIFYIGRALECGDNQVTRFKFLHKSGAKRFDWPRRHDVDEKHSTCVFYGPVSLQGNGPFEIDELDEIEAVFKNYIAKKGH